MAFWRRICFFNEQEIADDDTCLNVFFIRIGVDGAFVNVDGTEDALLVDASLSTGFKL